jgi:hypothetical protein
VRGASGFHVPHRDGVVAFAVDPDDVLELGDLAADRPHLLHLLLVLEDQGHRVGVLQHVLDLLRRVRLVDRHHGGADAQRGVIEVGPFRPGIREERDLVALADAEVDQAERQPLDDLADLAVGLRDPLARRILVRDGSELTVQLRGAREQVGDRLGSGVLLGGVRRCGCRG